jgi:hypothetical protein
LITDDGESLIESGAILDYVHELVNSARALLPASAEERRHALRLMTIATGVLSLSYATLRLRAQRSAKWRCAETFEEAYRMSFKMRHLVSCSQCVAAAIQRARREQPSRPRARHIEEVPLASTAATTEISGKRSFCSASAMSESAAEMFSFSVRRAMVSAISPTDTMDSSMNQARSGASSVC